jgi:hypothetical protein
LPDEHAVERAVSRYRVVESFVADLIAPSVCRGT